MKTFFKDLLQHSTQILHGSVLKVDAKDDCQRQQLNLLQMLCNQIQLDLANLQKQQQKEEEQQEETRKSRQEPILVTDQQKREHYGKQLLEVHNKTVIDEQHKRLIQQQKKQQMYDNQRRKQEMQRQKKGEKSKQTKQTLKKEQPQKEFVQKYRFQNYCYKVEGKNKSPALLPESKINKKLALQKESMVSSNKRSHDHCIDSPGSPLPTPKWNNKNYRKYLSPQFNRNQIQELHKSTKLLDKLLQSSSSQKVLHPSKSQARFHSPELTPRELPRVESHEQLGQQGLHQFQEIESFVEQFEEKPFEMQMIDSHVEEPAEV